MWFAISMLVKVLISHLYCNLFHFKARSPNYHFLHFDATITHALISGEGCKQRQLFFWLHFALHFLWQCLGELTVNISVCFSHVTVSCFSDITVSMHRFWNMTFTIHLLAVTFHILPLLLTTTCVTLGKFNFSVLSYVKWRQSLSRKVILRNKQHIHPLEPWLAHSKHNVHFC